VCCGLLQKEHTKLSKENQFFKCVICCLKAIPEVGQKQCVEIIENAKLVHHDLHASTYSHIDSPSVAVASSPLTEGSGSASLALSVNQKITKNLSHR